MENAPQVPEGGVDARKYAAISLALGMVRGALIDVLAGELDGAQRVLEITAISRIAEAIGCTENELVIMWDEHLTPSEGNRVKGLP